MATFITCFFIGAGLVLAPIPTLLVLILLALLAKG